MECCQCANVASANFQCQCGCAEVMVENQTVENGSDLNFTVSRDCDAAVFYGGAVAFEGMDLV